MQLGAANTLQEFRRIINLLKDKYLPYHEGVLQWEETVEENSSNLALPPWLCQSYVRLSPEDHLKKVEEKNKKIEEDTVNVLLYYLCLLFICFLYLY